VTRAALRLSLLLFALAPAACGGSHPGPSSAGASIKDEHLEVLGVGDALPFVVGSRHRDPISACAVSAGGRLLATGSVDGTLRLWLNSSQPVAAFRAHAARVQSVAFDSDTGVVATASKDGTAAVFRLSDGKALGRARVVLPELPAELYGSADGSTKSSWQLEFRRSELWLINVASFEPDAPARERLLGRLVGDSFEFSSRRSLRASNRNSRRAGHVFFSCPLEGQGLLQALSSPAPWSRLLTSSQRRWLAIARLKSNDPSEDEEIWSLLPLVATSEPLTLDPAPGRLQKIVDGRQSPLAVVRTETVAPLAATWSIQLLPAAKPLASFQTSRGPGAFALGTAHAFYSTPEGKLAAADYAGTPAALHLPEANDVRVVAISSDEELVAYATEATVVVWSLTTNAQLARFDGEPFVHVEELEFGASSAWLLVSSRAKVSAVDLDGAHPGAPPVSLALESSHFRAPAVVAADLTSARDQLLVNRQGVLVLVTAGSQEARQALQDARPQAQWALARDGARLLEARADGDVVLVDPLATESRRIANPVGAPRALRWVTNEVAAMLGDAGVALLSTTGATLQVDAVSEEGGGLSPVVFDSRGTSYAGSAAALRQVYRPRWGLPPTAASDVASAPQTVPGLIESFVVHRR
jgi:WD40 repeat protein